MSELFSPPAKTWAPGYYILDRMRLFSVDSKGEVTNDYDIIGSKSLIAMAITQSIFSNNIRAEITLNDSFNVFEDMNNGVGLQGEEYVDVNMFTPESGFLALQFMVIRVKDIERSTTNQTATYTLECVTKEVLINNTNTVNQSFRGTSSEIAKNIFDNRINKGPIWNTFFKNKPFIERSISVDKTHGPEELIIPGLNPFMAINMLIRRSNGGPTYPQSFYTFFENPNGYQFRNVQQMIKEKSVNNAPPENRKYTYRASPAAGDVMDKNQRLQIKGISSTTLPPPVVKLNTGHYKNHTRMVDVIGKIFKDINYSHKVTVLGKTALNTDDYVESLSSPKDFEYLTHFDSTKMNAGFQTLMAKRMSFMNSLTSWKYQIQLVGDLGLHAGEIINVDLPPLSHEIEDVKVSSKYSGDYLVTDVTHICDTDKINTSAIIIKDAV